MYKIVLFLSFLKNEASVLQCLSVPDLQSPPLSPLTSSSVPLQCWVWSHLHYNLKPHYLLFYPSFDSNWWKCIMYKYCSQFRIMIKWSHRMTSLSLKTFRKCSSICALTWVPFIAMPFHSFRCSHARFLRRCRRTLPGLWTLSLHRDLFCWSMPPFAPGENSSAMSAELSPEPC